MFHFYLPPFISKLIWASVEVLYIAVQKQPSSLFCKASEIIESLAGIQFYFYIFTDQILTSREMDQKVIFCSSCKDTFFSAFFLYKDFRTYRDGFKASRINSMMIGQINRTSWPVSLQMTFESGSFTIAAVMAGWLGAISLASFQIIVITGTLGFCIYYSMGSAVSVLVANAAGLNDRIGMRRIAFAGYHIMLTLAAISSTLFIVFGHEFINAFTEDPEVIAATVVLIVPLVLYQMGDATQINFANALRGTSHVMPMIWIAFVSYVVIGIPATYLLAFTASMGTYGIILSFSVSLFIAAALFLYFFMRATKRDIKVDGEPVAAQ